MANETVETFTIQGTKGYNLYFVESPPNDLVCKICLSVCCNPQQSNSCCGNDFCRGCLEKYVQSTVIDGDVCPYCRQPNFAFVPDLKAQRQVLNLQVYCPNNEQGCTWTGELRSVEKHLGQNVSNGCPFTEVQCNNDCGVVIRRNLLEDHLMSDCKLRQVHCEFCGTTGTYQCITGDHQKECDEYLMECPNHCKTGSIRRQDMTRHLDECPLAVVECPFAIVGCEGVVRRDNKVDHLKQTVDQHTMCNKNAIVSMQNELKEVKQLLQVKDQQFHSTQTRLNNTVERLSATENELDSVKQELKDIKKELNSRIAENEAKLQQLQLQVEENMKILMSSVLANQHPIDYANTKTGVLLIIRVTDFERKRTQREGWFSQSFHTSEQGYKMCLYLNVSGIGKGRGTHISIGAFLMKGDNDDGLSWPVKGSLHIQLLNQIADYNHVDIHLKFGSGGHSERVRIGTKALIGCYCDQVIAHSNLEYSTGSNTQYLKDDCLYCSVASFVPS